MLPAAWPLPLTACPPGRGPVHADEPMFTANIRRRPPRRGHARWRRVHNVVGWLMAQWRMAPWPRLHSARQQASLTQVAQWSAGPGAAADRSRRHAVVGWPCCCRRLQQESAQQARRSAGPGASHAGHVGMGHPTLRVLHSCHNAAYESSFGCGRGHAMSCRHDPARP